MLCSRILQTCNDSIGWLTPAGEHIENTLEALRALIKKDNTTPGGLKTLAYIEFDVHVSLSLVIYGTSSVICMCGQLHNFRYLHAALSTILLPFCYR